MIYVHQLDIICRHRCVSATCDWRKCAMIVLLISFPSLSNGGKMLRNAWRSVASSTMTLPIPDVGRLSFCDSPSNEIVFSLKNASTDCFDCSRLSLEVDVEASTTTFTSSFSCGSLLLLGFLLLTDLAGIRETRLDNGEDDKYRWSKGCCRVRAIAIANIIKK